MADDCPDDQIPWYAPGHHRVGIPRQCASPAWKSGGCAIPANPSRPSLTGPAREEEELLMRTRWLLSLVAAATMAVGIDRVQSAARSESVAPLAGDFLAAAQAPRDPLPSTCDPFGALHE